MKQGFLICLCFHATAFASFAAVDTVSIYNIHKLCNGDAYMDVQWTVDTLIEQLKKGVNGAPDTLFLDRIDVIPAPVISIDGDTVLCSGDNGTLKIQGQYALYAWSTGENSQSIQTALSGMYSVTVTGSNGCTATDSIRVYVSNPDVVINTVNPVCYNSSDGLIELSDLMGGFAPYEISFDFMPFGPDTTFAYLAADQYTITVRDKSGCTDSFFVELTAPPLFQIDIGPDIDLAFGDTIRLNVQSSSPVIRYVWSPSSIMDCDSCSRPLVDNPANGLIILEAYDGLNCMAKDSLWLSYKDAFSLFVPNVFSPGSSTDNSTLTIHPGPGNWEVTSFCIFDRWGSLVFQEENQIRYPDFIAWDGRLNGKYIQEGVYLWAAKLRLPDGQSLIKTGSISAVR